MKRLTKVLSMVSVLTLLATATACTSGAPANTVFGIDDLPGKSIGVQLGTTGDIYASDYKEEGSTIERFSKGVDAVQSLVQGKVDCVIIDSEPAKVFVENNESLTILEEPFVVEEYAMCLAKGNTELRDDINTALGELKADGTIDKILGNYIGDDTGSYQYTSPEGTTTENGVLVMATNAQFPPYESYGSDGKTIIGIDADIAQAVADKLGKELKIEDMEFDAIISAVDTGKADIGVAGMTVTEERLESVEFTDPYTESNQVIIVRK